MSRTKRLFLIGNIAAIYVVGWIAIGFWESAAACLGGLLAAYCFRDIS